MRAEAPAWPPNERQSSTRTESPSEAPYTAVARPAGPAPTNRYVVDAGRVDGAHEPKAAPELRFTGVAQELAPGAEHDRQFARIDVEPLDQRPRLRVALRVEAIVRVGVARQEPDQAQHVAIPRPADDDRPAGAGLDEPDAAQDERAHDALAELGLGDEQRAQSLRRNQQRLDVAPGVGIDERGTAGQLGEFAHERPDVVRDDNLRHRRLAPAGDGGVARENDRKAVAGFAEPHDRSARIEAAQLAEAPQPVDLGGLEHREHLFAARTDEGERWFGHRGIPRGPALD